MSNNLSLAKSLNLDVFFISMGEPGCEENWERLLTFVPEAKRVKNITGIFEVHKTCAKLSTTSNFWVVDADAWIVDKFDFNYLPDSNKLHWGVPENECVLIWNSVNPVNHLTYGYGGVKMFPRRPFLEDNITWQLDLSTTISKVVVSVGTVSCITRFNASPEQAWIGAFRECTKLSSLMSITNRIRIAKLKEEHELDGILTVTDSTKGLSGNKRTNLINSKSMLVIERYREETSIYSYWSEIESNSQRKLQWCTLGWDELNGKYSVLGAQAGSKFGLVHSDDIEKLNQINDWDWLKQEFKNVNV